MHAYRPPSADDNDASFAAQLGRRGTTQVSAWELYHHIFSQGRLTVPAGVCSTDRLLNGLDGIPMFYTVIPHHHSGYQDDKFPLLHWSRHAA